MFTVVSKQNINENIRRLDIRAERMTLKVRPGHFVAVMADMYSCSVPFSVYEVDWRRKCFAVIFDERDYETRSLGALKINDPVFRVSGPFGVPFPIEKTGTVLCVGEDLGLASLVPLCRILKQAGNKVIGIAGFTLKNEALLESQMRLNCSKFFLMYKDGAHERRGSVLTPLGNVLAVELVSRVYACVPMNLMKDIGVLCCAKNTPFFVNVLPLLTARMSFSEISSIKLGGRNYYPAMDGFMVSADRINHEKLSKDFNSIKEYAECRRKEAGLWYRPSVFERLKKSVWG